eukprot:3016292-Rhodomonas_salina.1
MLFALKLSGVFVRVEYAQQDSGFGLKRTADPMEHALDGLRSQTLAPESAGVDMVNVIAFLVSELHALFRMSRVEEVDGLVQKGDKIHEEVDVAAERVEH